MGLRCAIQGILAALSPILIGLGCSVFDATDDCTFTSTCPRWLVFFVDGRDAPLT
jgi:hypothetical protein